jgi:hypothetical protein
MWVTIANIVAGVLGGPFVKGAVDAYKAKLAAGTTEASLAEKLAERELSLQGAEITAAAQLKMAEIGHPWEPEKLAFYVTLIYYGKIVLWDVVLGLGSTDPLHGQAAVWAQMIMGFYFTKRGFENVSRILTRKWAK